jgi:hypothetical protein
LTTYRAWAQLNFEAREEWCAIFPDGKVPVKTIALQKIRFEGDKDPESVFSIDWQKLTVCQQEALLEKLSLNEAIKEGLPGVGFSFGHTNFCCFGTLDSAFMR